MRGAGLLIEMGWALRKSSLASFTEQTAQEELTDKEKILDE
jgi:hypothetical protein